jgi:ribonuclease PH
MRHSGGRGPDELRTVTITPGYLDYAEGSALVSWGRNRVLCAASVLETVPPFREYSGSGWVTGEYSMLPRATNNRQAREAQSGKVSGRTYEIQRLIGRSLRAVVDLQSLGPRTVVLDCDVLQADGGTRTAAISGALVALALALENLRRQGLIETMPLKAPVAAVSVALVGGRLLLDPDYEEDSQAAVDANFVATGQGDLIEVQATGEGGPFPATLMNEMLALAQKGIQQVARIQEEALAPWLPLPW